MTFTKFAFTCCVQKLKPVHFFQDEIFTGSSFSKIFDDLIGPHYYPGYRWAYLKILVNNAFYKVPDCFKNLCMYFLGFLLSVMFRIPIGTKLPRKHKTKFCGFSKR